MLSGSGGRGLVLFGRAGQLFSVGEQAAVCAPGLIEGGVRGDEGVLLKCICGFLSYACFMMEVMDWGGIGTAGCDTQCRVLCDLKIFYEGVCCARFPGGVCV